MKVLEDTTGYIGGYGKLIIFGGYRHISSSADNSNSNKWDKMQDSGNFSLLSSYFMMKLSVIESLDENRGKKNIDRKYQQFIFSTVSVFCGSGGDGVFKTK